MGAGMAATMDDEIHVYELDVADLLAELRDRLGPRGYQVTSCDGDRLWRFETRWRRGSAYGEIGSLIYSLIALKLREIER